MDSGELAFGKTYKWEDGLELTVSKPKSYKPGEYAAGAEGFTKFVQFTITIVNGTGKTFDPALFNASIQSGNEEGSQIFDGDFGGGPSTKLLKNRESKFRLAFGVADPKDLVLEVNPSFEHDSAIFTS